jgi:hypothetical protein
MSELKRTTDLHHDGHGLNESIVIEMDAEDPNGGGASHFYALSIAGVNVGALQFQQGPRNVPGSTPGVTEAAIYAILIDRLRSFQKGPYACRENAIQLTKLEECLMWTKERAHERGRRGVLGKNAK